MSLVGCLSLTVSHWRMKKLFYSLSLIVSHWLSLIGCLSLTASHWRTPSGGRLRRKRLRWAARVPGSSSPGCRGGLCKQERCPPRRRQRLGRGRPVGARGYLQAGRLLRRGAWFDLQQYRSMPLDRAFQELALRRAVLLCNVSWWCSIIHIMYVRTLFRGSDEFYTGTTERYLPMAYRSWTARDPGTLRSRQSGQTTLSMHIQEWPKTDTIDVCVCVFFPSILDINGRTSRGHTGGRSHRIFNPPSFCGACLDFCREKDSAIPFPRRPWSRILCTNELIVLHPLGIFICFFSF